MAEPECGHAGSAAGMVCPHLAVDLKGEHVRRFREQAHLPQRRAARHFKKYLAAGKPFVGYRAASHVFQNWLEVDQQVFGATYGGHHLLNKEKNPGLNIELMTGAAEHPILKGLEPPKPASGSYSYTKLADDVTVRLKSGFPGDMMPHTWVREHAKTKNRVFYTRYDAKELATNETCRAIFLLGGNPAQGLNRGSCV